MFPLLVPSRTEDRVFAKIDPNFHEEIPSIPGQLGGLLTSAVEAERNRLWRRADFLWRELHRAVRSQPGLWNASYDFLDADEARRRFVTEVLVEVHCGFYNGWVEDQEPTKPDDRAFAHLDYVRELHDLSNLSDDEQAELLRPALLARINLWLEAGDPASAREIVEELLQETGRREYLETLIGLHVVEIHSQLQGGESEAANQIDARTLQGALERLHALLGDYPDHLGLYQAMGYFHHLRAVTLANSRKLAQALEQVQRALTYDPSLKQARETRAQLKELMKKLQQEMHKAEAKMATLHPDATMTEEGHRLKRQADLGFDLMDAFAESPQAEEIARARRQAKARAAGKTTEVEAAIDEEESDRCAHALVLEIVQGPARGRDIEPFGPWLRSRQHLFVKLQAAAAVLLLMITSLMAFREARNRAARAELYHEALEAAAYGDYDRVIDRVEAFRSRSLLAEDKEREKYLTRLLGDAKEIKARVESIDALRRLETSRDADSETARETRDRAYEALRAAVDQRDYQRALEAAERYLATPFFGASDHRKTQVYDLYNEAFVHWFLTQGDDLGDHQVHVDRFRALANV